MLLVRIMLFLMSRGAPVAKPVRIRGKAARSAVSGAQTVVANQPYSAPRTSEVQPVGGASQKPAEDSDTAAAGAVTREEMQRLFGRALRVR